MEFSEFLPLALKTESKLAYKECRSRKELWKARTSHALFGIFSEYGELLDTYKKSKFHGAPFDKTNMAEEIGDIFWYLAIVVEVELEKYPDSDILQQIACLEATVPVIRKHQNGRGLLLLSLYPKFALSRNSLTAHKPFIMNMFVAMHKIAFYFLLGDVGKIRSAVIKN